MLAISETVPHPYSVPTLISDITDQETGINCNLAAVQHLVALQHPAACGKNSYLENPRFFKPSDHLNFVSLFF